MTRIVERTMSREEAQELIDAMNIALQYGFDMSRYSYSRQIIDGGWSLKEIDDNTFAAGYRYELDADTVLEEDEQEEEDEE